MTDNPCNHILPLPSLWTGMSRNESASKKTDNNYALFVFISFCHFVWIILVPVYELATGFRK